MPSSVSEVDGKFESLKQKLSKEKSFNDCFPPEDSANTSMKNILRTFVTEHYGKLLKTFSTYDTNNNSTISVKDFRNTLDLLFVPLTDKDFENILCQVLRNPDGSICYHDFLNQFCSTNEPVNFSPKPRHATPFTVSPIGIKRNSLEEIKQCLSEKFCKNVVAALRAFQFYDYNRNGKIDKNSFRKILNKFDFRLTNQQIERLWISENCNHSQFLDYNHFIQKLVTSGNTSNSSSGNMNIPSAADFWDPKTGIVITPSSTWPPYQKLFQLTPSDENEMLRRFEIQMRDVIFRHHYKIRKAFEGADPKLQGLVSVEDLRQILESYMKPMSDELFGNLMKCLGLQSKGLIAWQVFLNQFRYPKDANSAAKTVEFMDIPREIIPLKNTNTDINANTVLFHLRQSFIHQFGSIDNAFKKLDHRRRGWLTRLDVEAEVKKLYSCLNEKEYQDVCILLDPEHGNRIYLPTFLEVLKGETPKTPVEISESFSQANVHPLPPKTMSWEKVEQILREHLVSKCEELENQINLASTKAFGLLSSKSFKSILDTIAFPIEEQHFQNLLKRYTTPRKDGLIDCQQFLKKMVGTENLSIVQAPIPGKSVSNNCCMIPAKKNMSSRDQPGNSSLVSAQRFPYVLAEKSQKSGQSITKNYLTYRKAGKDILTLETLENLLKNFGICISGSELNKLWKRCDPEEKGYAFYEDFLTGCGLEELYTRNNEVSSLGYILMWKVAGEKRPSSSTTSTKVTTKSKMDYDGLSPEFILREMILKSPHNIRKTISNLKMNKSGEILLSDLQRILIGYGLRLTETQWNLILKALGMEGKDAINLQQFMDFVKQGYGQTECGSKRYSTLKDVENMIHEVVANRKTAFLVAFREADYNNLNVVCKEDFESILYKFGIQMDPDMFPKFWSILPLNERDNLLYKDFVAWFSNPNRQLTTPHHCELPERPKTAAVLSTCGAQPQTSICEDLGKSGKYIRQLECKPSLEEQKKADETRESDFVEKISGNLKEALNRLNQTCITAETFLPPEVLKSVLESVSQPISDEIFSSILNRYVTARHDGFVNYQEFLARLVRWRSDNGRSLVGEIRRVNPSISAERNQPFQLVTASQLPPLLAKLSQNHFHNVTKGYLTFTKAGKDLLNMSTLKNFLKAFNISMSDSEINKLWSQCDPENKGYITYEEFLERCGLEELYKGSSETKSSKYVLMWKLIEKESSQNMTEPPDTCCRCNTSDTMAGDNRVDLNPEDYLKQNLMKMPLDIWKAISDLDVQKCNLVPAVHFQNLLTTHGINMTGDEWKQVLMPFLNGKGLINIKSFISNLLYGKVQSTSNEDQLLPKFIKEIEKMISTHSKDFLVAFKEADNALQNTVSQESFQDILKKFGINTDQETFLKYWSLLPVNEDGNLMYQDFLEGIKSQIVKRYTYRRPSSAVSSTYQPWKPWKPAGPHFPSTGRTSAEILPLAIHSARRKERAVTANVLRRKNTERIQLLSRLVNAEQAEQLVKNVILSNWKLIQKKCRLGDPDCTGYIDPEKFKEILLLFMKHIPEEKFIKLREKFDIKGDGTLAYRDLIRYFIFDQKPTRIVPGQHRLLRQADNDELEMVPTEGLLGEALKRLHLCVIKNWRLMRRSFQVADPSKTDHVDVISFRQILKCHNVNLTEEEFFQIMSFYDKDFSASINYYNFLRAFLQNW